MQRRRFSFFSKKAHTLNQSDRHRSMVEPLENRAYLSAPPSVLLVSAVANASTPSITLTWPQQSGHTYAIYRKTRAATSWGSQYGTATSTGFVDTSVSNGQEYEYKVQDSGNLGYVVSGIDVAAVEHRGTMILIVDKTYAAELTFELSRLEQDLVGDGWSVIRHDVDRHTDTDHDNSTHDDEDAYIAGVSQVKNLIQDDYDNNPSDVKAVFLFGHVPVPYSGTTPWDGHYATNPIDPDDSSHIGAWATDIYYGDMTGGAWPDTQNPSAAAVTNCYYDPSPREENWNEAGDGKFDVDYLNEDQLPELAVGRVDMARLSVFSEPEVELLRRYLDKDHAYRTDAWNVPRRGLIDHYWTDYNRTSWGNEAALFGASNITEASWSWFPTLSSNAYLWASGSGPGTYTNAYHIGGTADYATTPTYAVFNTLLGSHFGDWDSDNNFLRAPLANDGFGLTSTWGGLFVSSEYESAGYYHGMGMGETIGDGLLSTQTRAGTTYYSGTLGIVPALVVNSLMGDPSLRLHTVAPASNLQISSASGGGVDIDWDASSDTSVAGYYIYRASSPFGPFTRVNTGSYTIGTSYTDSSGTYGSSVYMVRAVKLETGSGTYYNLSQGIFSAALIVGADSADSITVQKDPVDSTVLNFNIHTGTVSTDFNLDSSAYNQVFVFSQQGADELIVDDVNGEPSLPSGFVFKGGSGSDSLKFENISGTEAGSISGSQVAIGSSLVLSQSIENIGLFFDGGIVTVNNDASLNSAGCALTVSGSGQLIFGASQHLKSLLVDDGALIKLATDGSRVIRTGGLAISSGSSLDITNNSMVIDYSGTSPLFASGGVFDLIENAYHAGAWDDWGLTSSSITTGTHGLGYGEASSLYTSFPATFSGESIDSSTIVVRYTLIGDVNLDRTVNYTDYQLQGQNYGLSSMTWIHGDFDFDNDIDYTDYQTLGQHFGQTL